MKALRRACVAESLIEEVPKKAEAGDFDHAVRTIMYRVETD